MPHIFLNSIRLALFMHMQFYNIVSLNYSQYGNYRYTYIRVIYFAFIVPSLRGQPYL